MRIQNWAIGCFFLCTLTAEASFVKASFVKASSLEQALVSCYAVNSKTGEVLINEEGGKSLLPASCMKLFTTGVALHILGPDAYFTTTLSCDGPLDEKGVLQGNLYIVGGGDPSLGSERIAHSIEQQLDIWVRSIREAGILQIQGEVIADASLWEDAMAPPSWSWEDLGNYYGAGASALSFHENAYTVFFRPGKKLGERAQIEKVEPKIPELTLLNEVQTAVAGSGDQACIYGVEYTPLRYLRGSIPQGEELFSIRGAIPNPPLLVSQLLQKHLETCGIAVKGDAIERREQRVLYVQHSPSLEKIVYETNQESLNLYAEHLLKKLGQERYLEGSVVAGTRAITQFLQEQGLDCKGLHIADGSGLSRKNHVTAKQLVSFLLFMKNSLYRDPFLASLPHKEDVMAKTGSMSFVRAKAGYKGDIIFAIIINNSFDYKESVKRMDIFINELK